MRRRIPFAVAALAAGGVVALCAGTLLGAAVNQAPRVVAGPAADLTSIPADLVWRWVVHCMQDHGEASNAIPLSYSVGPDGGLSVSFGWGDDQGHVTVDPRMAAVTKECIEEKSVELATVVSRYPTEAERLVLYEWAVERQQPCLAARGMNAMVAPLGDFVDDTASPWYLLDAYAVSQQERGLGIDFDTLLAARRACPPMPAYLAAEGVGW